MAKNFHELDCRYGKRRYRLRSGFGFKRYRMHSFYIDTVEIKEVCSRADINDENYPSEWQNNANYYKSFKITDADAHSGSGSFVTTAKNAFMRLSYNDKAIRVSNGTVYLMSFWYKASSGTPEISFVTADAENVSSGAVKQASYKNGEKRQGQMEESICPFHGGAAGKQQYSLAFRKRSG